MSNSVGEQSQVEEPRSVTDEVCGLSRTLWFFFEKWRPLLVGKGRTIGCAKEILEQNVPKRGRATCLYIEGPDASRFGARQRSRVRRDAAAAGRVRRPMRSRFALRRRQRSAPIVVGGVTARRGLMAMNRDLSLGERLLLHIRAGGWHTLASVRDGLESFMPPERARERYRLAKKLGPAALRALLPEIDLLLSASRRGNNGQRVDGRALSDAHVGRIPAGADTRTDQAGRQHHASELVHSLTAT